MKEKKRCYFPNTLDFLSYTLDLPLKLRRLLTAWTRIPQSQLLFGIKWKDQVFYQPQVSVWKMLAEGYPGWNWSINAMGRHLQHPTEPSWRERAPRLRPALHWSPPCQLNPGTTAMAWPSLDTNTPHWIHLNISAHPFQHTSEGIQCQQLWERRNSVQPLPAIEITVQKWHLPKNPPGRASNQTCKTHFPTLENLSGCNDSCGILTGLVNWSKVCGKVYNQDLK